MFTGIVTDTGLVNRVDRESSTHSLIIAPCEGHSGLSIGASIACDGVCLTIVEKSADNDWFRVNLSPETCACTTLGAWQEGQRINLERSLRVGDELGGHIVSGHVDDVTEVTAMDSVGENCILSCRMKTSLAPYIAVKGSVCLNGVSLTVNQVSQTDFTVNLIPHTRAVTTWGETKRGDKVNVEVDLLARYMARFREVETVA